MSEEGSPYQGELFPCDYLVLYCPFDDCPLDKPFMQADALLKHLESAHRTTILNVNAVLPVMDHYLQALKQAGILDSIAADDSLCIDERLDESIRTTLQKQKLVEILALQAKERAELYGKPRQCLFCMEFSPNLKDLFTHMFKEHKFNIGLLDNLVMVDDFLKTLEGILKKNVCISCQNEFRSYGCLRKHMKNKHHYKIDPKNHFYDKYYVVNYIRCGALGNDENEKEAGNEEEEEDNWNDLNDDVDLRTTCVFCEKVFDSPGRDLLDHCKEAHDFDLEAVRAEFSNDLFHDYIKLITCIRHHIKDLCCPVCNLCFKNQEELQGHFKAEGHSKIPDRQVWDQPQYLFPVFDDDPLLFHFGDDIVE